MDFSIRAVYYFDEEERPWKNDEITVFVDNGPFLPDHCYEASTDDDGIAVFDIEDRSTKLGLGEERAKVKIYARGNLKGEYTVEDGDQLTINVSED